MKIAVTYDNGQVFQHFGRTEAFKIYNVEDGQVVNSEILSSNGSGHGALAAVLADAGVNVLICGGCGAGAQQALAEAGIDVCTGAQGNTDAAVSAYLAGQLESAGVNCDHHHHEEGHHCGEHGCGSEACGSDDDASGCGSNCGGGCGGGCGGQMQPLFEGKNVMKTCRVHYRGTFNDGTQFDSSYDRGETLDFVCGVGMMIPGFDRAVAEMNVGDVIDIHLMPAEAYGEVDPNAILKVEIAQLPGSEDLSVGQQVYLSTPTGQPFPVVVTAKDEVMITLDANHEMAGKELNFKIELVEISE